MISVQFKEISYEQFDRRHIRSAFGRAARAMATKVRGMVRSSGGGGPSYRRGGRTYTASAPGSPPGRFTGNLARSVKGRRSRRGYALVIHAAAPHAHLLELSTAKMAARPYFAPSFANRAEVIGIVRAAYAKALIATPGAVGRPPKSVEIN